MPFREPNVRRHRYYQKRFHARLTRDDISKDWIEGSGIEKIDSVIADKGHLSPNGFDFDMVYHGGWDRAWYNESAKYEVNGFQFDLISDFKLDTHLMKES